MILPRRPMTPRTHGTSETTERGSVKRMISWTVEMGSAYSSLPSEKTTSCWVDEDATVSDMFRSASGTGVTAPFGRQSAMTS